MIVDFLISKDGLRLAEVDLRISGVRMAYGPTGFVPRSADLLHGEVHIALSDLARALARPEPVDQLLGGVAGLARPEINLVDGDEPGSIRVVGSVEVMGRRIPITAATRVSIVRNRLTFAATQLEGLPLLRSLPVQPFDLALPLTLPAGLEFTGVTTRPGHVVLTLEGRDYQFAADAVTSA
ncbi:MAG: LmeA family phospholipid-binding protein [Jatrophihabitans sp.]|uniref:LmeA family phospholipid-binding protein n=1 Tax=Jatrophihabitans sp. TaxID=1932789 RepID=UPI003F7ED199